MGITKQVGANSSFKCRLQALQVELPTVSRLSQRHRDNLSSDSPNRCVERWIHRRIDNDAFAGGSECPQQFGDSGHDVCHKHKNPRVELPIKLPLRELSESLADLSLVRVAAVP